MYAIRSYYALVLFDFEKNIDVKSVTPIDATYEAIKTEKSQVLKVESGVLLNESGVKLFRTTNNNWNLNGYYQVKARITSYNVCYTKLLRSALARYQNIKSTWK